MQGARESQQVLDDLTLFEPFDFDGLIAQLRRAALQLGDQRIKMAASADEDGDTAGRMGGALIAEDGDDLAGFVDVGVFGVLRDEYGVDDDATQRPLSPNPLPRGERGID